MCALMSVTSLTTSASPASRFLSSSLAPMFWRRNLYQTGLQRPSGMITRAAWLGKPVGLMAILGGLVKHAHVGHPANHAGQDARWRGELPLNPRRPEQSEGACSRLG